MKTKNINEDFNKIMIIVPHEDDELIMSAGIIRNAILEGKNITVVMVTNGDYGCDDYSIGRARLRETIEGLKLLGLEEEHIVFMGYADTGMPEEDSFLFNLYLSQKDDEVIKSHCSINTYGLCEKLDFHTEHFKESAAYTRKNIYGDLKLVIEKYKPTEIFTTSEYDTHGDHKALYLFVVDILKELRADIGYTAKLYSGIVHSCAGDEKWPIREECINEFSCPDFLETMTDYKWDNRISFQVPDSMREVDRSKNLKYQAISKHVTALKPDAIDYLFSFVKSDEVFWEINWEEN